MPDLLPAFLSALGLSLLLTPACGWLATRLGILDVPSTRKIHRRPTPLLGGVAVYLAVAAAILVFVKPDHAGQTFLLLAGAAAFGVIGLVDDLLHTGAWKLAAEAAVVVVVVWLGGFRVLLPWPYAGEVLAVLWIVGVANAMNCLDCVDGAAAGVVAVGALAFVPLAILWGRLAVAGADAAVLGAALGFLRYNFPPARIFLGDAGSLMLGFLLAALSATLVVPQVHSSVAIWVAPVLILGVPAGDFLLVHVRRYLTGVRNPLRLLTSTGKDHLPHRLLDAGLSHRQVALWLYGASAVTGGSGVVLILWGPLLAALLVVPVLAAGAAGWLPGTGGQARLPKTEG